jgi:predicted metal-dependent hydrolase
MKKINNYINESLSSKEFKELKEEVTDWIEDRMESWSNSWDDDEDGCKQCKNDLERASDYFSNELFYWLDENNYKVSDNERHKLEKYAQDYADNKAEEMKEYWSEKLDNWNED